MVEEKDIQTESGQNFLRAARAGNLSKLVEHLNNKTDINTANSNGLNALHLAAKEGHMEVVRELLRRGAQVDAATKKGNTALHIACLAGQIEVVKLLVQAEANVNIQSQNGFTPLYMASQENHVEVVSYLLSNNANQTTATYDGFTPLAVALQQGHDRVVTLLLENDARSKVRLPALHIAAKKDDVNAANLLLMNETNIDHQSASGFTPLHIASHYGNENVAKLLISRGANVNFQAKNNITPLHVAAKWGRTNLVRVLLESGAMVDCRTRDGLTPLHCASRSGYTLVVEMLIDSSANYSAKTRNGLSPLHMAAQGDHDETAKAIILRGGNVNETTVDYLTPLHVAAHCGNLKVAEVLLDRRCDPNARALNGFTPLHIACKKLKIKMVELLLRYGALIEATTETGLTPLHVAAFIGAKEIVQLLIQKGANVDQATMRCETPLHLATRNNQVDVVKILLKNGAAVDAKARENQTPLHVAVRTGNLELVGILLGAGANPNLATKDNYSALHIAAKEGRSDVASLLIDNGAEVEARTKKGFTPLHVAAKYGKLNMAKLMIEARADVNATGCNGLTPLHVATHYNHTQVAQLLIDHGGNPQLMTKNGYTPLHIAAKKNHLDLATLLLLNDSDPNAESRNGFTPIHLAAEEGHTDMVSLLLQNKADPNYKAKNGLTPMHLAAQEDRVSVAQILVNAHGQVSPVTKAGYTPLHTACHFGQINMIRFLLSRGSDVNSKTNLGFTPLHLAAQQGHLQVVYLLLENGADPNVKNQQGWTPAHIARRQHYLNIFEVLRRVTTIVESWEEVEEEIIELERPEHMGEHHTWDSEEEGATSPITQRPHVGRRKIEDDSVFSADSTLDRTGNSLMVQQIGSFRMSTSNDELWQQMEYMNTALESGPKSTAGESFRSHASTGDETQESAVRADHDFSAYSRPPVQDAVDAAYVPNNFAAPSATDWDFEAENVMIVRKPVTTGFLVSFLVDARGGTMQAQRHQEMRILVPPSAASAPTRVTCRLMRAERVANPPQLSDGEGLACRILEMGPSHVRFNSPILLEVPHYASLRGREREVTVIRSDDGLHWREHPLEATEQAVHDAIGTHFDGLATNEELRQRRVLRILTTDFPLYFALVSRIRQETASIGSEGGVISSTVVTQVQAVFPEGALQKKIKVGIQALSVLPDVIAKLCGNRVAVSPIVTIEPRRRKFHKPITLTIPLPKATAKGMINPGTESTTLRLLCSITGGNAPAQWEDITGSSPLTRMQDCVSFTTTVSARLWLIDCPNASEVSEMAGRLYHEATLTPYIGSFVVYARRHEPEEAQLRVLCVTDDSVDKTLECQENFELVASGPPIEVLNNRPHWIETVGNLVPVTKSGDQLNLKVTAFRENRLPFLVRVKDVHSEPVGKVAIFTATRSGPQQSPASTPGGQPPQKPITTLEVRLPADLVPLGQGYRREKTKTKTTTTTTINTHVETSAIAKSELDLREVANLVGGDWPALYRELGMQENTALFNDLMAKYRSEEERAYQLLIRWQQEAGPKATGNELERALRMIGREDVVKTCMHNISYVTTDDERHEAEERLHGSDEKLKINGHEVITTRTSLHSDPDAPIVPVVDPSRAMAPVDHKKDKAEREKAYLGLIEQLDRVLPEPELLTGRDSPSGDHSSVQEEEVTINIVERPALIMDVEALPKSKPKPRSTVPKSAASKEEEEEEVIKARKASGEKPVPVAPEDEHHKHHEHEDMDLEVPVEESHTSEDDFEKAYEQALVSEKEGEEKVHEHDDHDSGKEGDDGHDHHHHHGMTETHEVIEGKPQEHTEVEETEETLDDGTVVKKKVMKTEISQMITERQSREFCDDYHPSEHDDEECCEGEGGGQTEHEIITEEPEEHIDVKEIEETLPDGTVVKRKITTKRVTQKVTEKIVMDEMTEEGGDECCHSHSEDEDVPEDSEVKEMTETLPDGSTVTRRVVVKRTTCPEEETSHVPQGAAQPDPDESEVMHEAAGDSKKKRKKKKKRGGDKEGAANE